MKLLVLVALAASVVAVSYAAGIRGETDPDPHERYLQDLPPGLVPEAALILAAVPAVDKETLSHYETPINIRFVMYYTDLWWDCIAVYSNSFKSSLTNARPVVRVDSAVTPHSSANRAVCGAQAVATFNSLASKVPQTGYLETMRAFEAPYGFTLESTMPKDVAACHSEKTCLQSVAAAHGYSPVIMGHIVAQIVYGFSLKDGYNPLGTADGCTVNCRSYKDTTGYMPVNSPNDNASTSAGTLDRWQPLLEDNGNGFFFYQQHVTPHIGKVAKFRSLPESDRIHRVAAKPNYTKSRVTEARQVMASMKGLADDKAKMEVEAFDNKNLVAGAVLQGYILHCLGLTVPDVLVDPVLGPGGGYIMSYERIIHFMVGFGKNDYDSTVIAWKEKVNYDLIRPTSVIKRKGPNRLITTWAPGGVQTFRASDFEAYIRVMPHSEYVSGSGCLFQAIEEYITGYVSRIGLAPDFPIAFPPYAPGSSKVQPGVVPATEITLAYDTPALMNEAGSQSRITGGMHFEASVTAGQKLCSGIAAYSLDKTFALIA